MPRQASFSYARANLAKVMDAVVDDAEVVLVRRRNGKHAAIIAAAELERLTEAVFLLGSPRNRRRLLDALAQSRAGMGRRLTLTQLCATVHL